jgi:hypothetical protein
LLLSFVLFISRFFHKRFNLFFCLFVFSSSPSPSSSFYLFIFFFCQGSLQYTLEEKYIGQQRKYYFESGEKRFLLLLQEGQLLDLQQGCSIPVLRRPILLQMDWEVTSGRGRQPPQM